MYIFADIHVHVFYGYARVLLTTAHVTRVMGVHFLVSYQKLTRVFVRVCDVLNFSLIY